MPSCAGLCAEGVETWPRLPCGDSGPPADSGAEMGVEAGGGVDADGTSGTGDWLAQARRLTAPANGCGCGVLDVGIGSDVLAGGTSGTEVCSSATFQSMARSCGRSKLPWPAETVWWVNLAFTCWPAGRLTAQGLAGQVIAGVVGQSGTQCVRLTWLERLQQLVDVVHAGVADVVDVEQVQRRATQAAAQVVRHEVVLRLHFDHQSPRRRT